MIEIIILILLSIQIARIVKEKGYSKAKYIFLTIIVWFVFQVIGAIIGYIIFKDYILTYILSFAFSFLSYHLIYSYSTNLKSKRAEAIYQENKNTEDKENRDSWDLETTPQSLKTIIFGLTGWAVLWHILSKGETHNILSQMIQSFGGIIITIGGLVSLIINIIKKR